MKTEPKPEDITQIDKEKVFEEEIRPLFKEAMKKCADNGIPAFYACAAINNEEKTIYLTDMISAVSNNIVLKDDKIVDFANVLNNFYTVPVKKEGSFMLDEIDEVSDLAGELFEGIDEGAFTLTV